MRSACSRLGLALAAIVSLAACDAGVEPEPPRAPTPYELVIPDGFPPMPIPPNNPMTVEGVELGRQLFQDPLFSADETKSCASCHLGSFAFADPKPTSEGVGGARGTRNAMPIINLGWAPSLFWDGRVESLEAQAVSPIPTAHEFNTTWHEVVRRVRARDDYLDQFEVAFGTRAPTQTHVVRALAQFERTLISADAKADRVRRGEAAFTPLERRGFELFNSDQIGCFHCHGTVLFTDNRFHNNGLDLFPADSGRALVTKESFDLGKFRTPTLRNVAHTAPYMHDGRFATLREVVEHYNTGITQSAQLDPLLHNCQDGHLSPDDVEALVAFLETLSDPAFLERARTLVPGAPAPAIRPAPATKPPPALQAGKTNC